MVRAFVPFRCPCLRPVVLGCPVFGVCRRSRFGWARKGSKKRALIMHFALADQLFDIVVNFSAERFELAVEFSK